MINAQTGLPDFMDGHVLVSFHRGNDVAYDTALGEQTEEEQRLQAMLSAKADGDYPAMDVAVVHAVEQAEGVTSYSGKMEEVDGFMSQLLGADQVYLHRPVLDLDMNAALIPSATEGHFHLYIDHLVSWESYERLLEAMAECGILEQGYVDASIDRGYSSARLPTKPKGYDHAAQ